MNDGQIEDLKQFFVGTLSQTEARLTEKIEHVEAKLTARMDDGFAGVGEAINVIHQDLVDHEKRITKLEQQAA